MKTDNYWFYIEPFVHIEIKKSSYLLYNSLNSSYIKGNNIEIKALLNDLINNDFVIKINHKSFVDKSIKLFINKVKRNFMGDFFLTSFSEQKPVQFGLNINVKPYKSNLKMDVLNYVEKYKLIKNLKRITIYINSEPINNSVYDFAYKQFICNAHKGKTYNEIKYDEIKKILENLFPGIAPELNIIGGNIIKYSNLKLLIEYINKLGKQTNYYFKHEDLIDIERNKIFQNASKVNSKIMVLVENNYSQQEIKIINDYFLKNNFKFTFKFIISDINDLNKAEKILNDLKIKKFQYLPLYIKSNLIFFKDAVFIEESDIINIGNNQINIIQNKVINMFDFGSLTFLPDGNCYTNINSEPIGNIYNKTVSQLIHYCLAQTDKDWFLIRNDVKPCKDCIFNTLCPPISNYERVIKQYNLCNIKN